MERLSGEDAPGFSWDTGAGHARPAAARPPASTAARGGCAFHPDEHAVALCSNCGTPVCADCRREAEGPGPVPRLLLLHGREAGAPGCRCHFTRTPEPSFPEARWKLWPGLAFLPFPFLLELLTTYMINQGARSAWGRPCSSFPPFSTPPSSSSPPGR